VTSGLKTKAAPHNPAPAATNLMLNRSKIVIGVDTPSFPFETSPFKVVQQNLVPYRLRSTTASIVNGSCRTRDAPHRTVSKR
jgi:hypothetical protein